MTEREQLLLAIVSMLMALTHLRTALRIREMRRALSDVVWCIGELHNKIEQENPK